LKGWVASFALLAPSTAARASLSWLRRAAARSPSSLLLRKALSIFVRARAYYTSLRGELIGMLTHFGRVGSIGRGQLAPARGLLRPDK
jgi:hypothetical protein